MILAVCQLAAEGVVLWGLITNVCTLLTASLAWTASLFSVPPARAPLVLLFIDKELWRTFTAKFLALDLILSPFYLIIKALGTLIVFRKFHDFVFRLSTTWWISNGGWKRYKSRVLHRCIAVISAFFLINILLSAVVASMTFATISLGFRGWASVAKLWV